MCSMPLLKFSVVCWQSLVLLGLYQHLPHLHLYLHVASCVCMCVHIPPFLVSTEGPDLWWFNLTFFNFAMVWQWNAFSRNRTLNFVPSKIGVFCFPQSYGSPTIESHWPSRSDSLGIPSPFVRSPGLEACCGVQNLHNSGRTSLVLLFSSLWITYPAGMGFDFIVIVLLLPSCCSFFFVFGHGVSFFGMFRHPPMDGCSIGSGDFGNLKGGDEHTFFYSTILNQKSHTLNFALFPG